MQALVCSCGMDGFCSFFETLYFQSVLQGLLRRGWDLTVIADRPLLSSDDAHVSGTSRTVWIRPSAGLHSYDALHQAVLHSVFALAESCKHIQQVNRPSPVLALGAANAVTGASLARAFGRPLVAVLAQTQPGKQENRLLRKDVYVAELEHWLVRQSAAVLCPHSQVASELNRFYELPSGDVIDCPPVFHPSTGPLPAERFGALLFGLDRRFLVFCGDFELADGVHLLLEAAPDIIAARPDCGVVFCGDGSLEQQLAQRSDDLPLEGAVKWIGPVWGRVLAWLLRDADLAVVAHRYEPARAVLTSALATQANVVTGHFGARCQGLVAVERLSFIERLTVRELKRAVLSQLEAGQVGAREGSRLLQPFFTPEGSDTWVEELERRLGAPQTGERTPEVPNGQAPS